MSIVFFANPAFPSAYLRGKQIAERINGAYNPANVKDTDTIIMVKFWRAEIAEHCKNVYVDLVDDERPLWVLYKYPHIKVIALSSMAVSYIKARVANEVIVIPHHHCNFENVTRPVREVKAAGYCGINLGLNLNINELTRRLSDVGLEFRFLDCEKPGVSREQVCQFYSEIDIQIAFRGPWLSRVIQPELKCPLKLANAGSFKVPTAAFPETGWREGFNTFMHARSLDKLVDSCRILKEDKATYKYFAKKAYKFSQDYSIDKIIKLYLNLEKPS
jgi:hypothetical protein